MTLRLKLVHKKHEIQVAIPPHEAVKETFGDLKQIAAREFGIETQYLRLLFRGREKRDEENVMLSGVKNGHVISVVETADYMRQRAEALAAANRPTRVPEPTASAGGAPLQADEQQAQVPSASGTPVANGVAIGTQTVPQAEQHSQQVGGQQQQQQQQAAGPPQPQRRPQSEGEAMLDRIAAVHADVDSLAARAGALMVEVDWESRSKQKAMLNELLTRHLLTLDSIQAVAGETPPEVRAARKAEIVRINQLMDNLDSVK